MRRTRHFLLVGICLLLPAVSMAEPPLLVKSEFIYEKASFDSCHASTIAETPGGLVTAWFGGTDEGNKDVAIWTSRQVKGKWTAPEMVIDGIQEDGSRHPCWNPVLFQQPDGPLLLFAKVGPSPRTWWGVLISSADNGVSWSSVRRLPEGQAGPIKNKPVLLKDGRLLCGSSSEDQGWRVHMEWTTDVGATWKRTGVLNDGKEFGAIQPTILRHKDGSLQILCRSKGLGKIVQATSTDGGRNWSPLTPTSLPNPNSGIDAVTLADGRHVLIYNHTLRGRSPINLAVSDDGKTWSMVKALETDPGEYSYPAIIQAADGTLHVTYTWKRQKVKHLVLDPKGIAGSR
ncbi:MAG: sialidase [Planctomycetaceae bacterium]|nr:sialidase [Planctomycetaceae bacterium]